MSRKDKHRRSLMRWYQDPSLVPPSIYAGRSVEETQRRLDLQQPGNRSIGRPAPTWQLPSIREPRKAFTHKIAISKYGSMLYTSLLNRLGADVLVVYPNTKLADIDKCDGLVIPGGRDVNPGWYGETPHPRTQFPADNERDALEIALVKRALDNDMPILGICRGHQVLNVAAGGSLIQDLKGHVTDQHWAVVNPESRHLSYILDSCSVEYPGGIVVNSLHHQAVDRLGKGLIVAAYTDDEEETVEAIEHTEHSFAVGVQWHPEMQCTPRFRREMDKLLVNFMNTRKKE